jgi:cell division protease FtsH
MSDKLGMVQYGDDNDFVFLGKEMAKSKEYSESTAQEIDEEVKRLIGEGFQRAKKIITENQSKLELIATSLLEHETLDGAQVAEIVETGNFTPPTPPEDSLPAEEEPETPKKSASSDVEIESGFDGPAPATA